ncbi:ribokinase [Lentilactobacillus farraginis]|uniref:Deoxyribokinase n=1 Tax=Lentilactobacillus farraginis DSM 18382 = JCM 14108 TaxID=1423743 RepID=X0PKX5_9LACO|nr:ribokinase [Lentilactobacillus farraginis]KRM06775.1 ribokinase [Lentilactobacillus farraginis DSM 18382 = JCM 14108]GAF38007.1 ribokinase [Lentilactobacillus farraginis DSM 18382 = JCM 14108]
MNKSDVLVIGSNMIDLISYINRMPVEGETVEAPDFQMGFGGKGANQAVAAARLGSKVSFISMVGNDAFGQQQLNNFKNNNIDTTGVGIGTKSSGAAPIFVDKSSDNRILIIKGANNELTPEILDKYVDLIKGTKIIVLQQEIPLETNYRAIDLANLYHVPVLLNPAPANKSLDINHVKKVDFFSPNETELATLTGMPTNNMDEIKKAAHHMIKLGVKNMLVTLGSKGVLWMNENNSQIIKALKVNAIDTTGAGDSFIGSFAHYYANGDDIPTAIKHANQYAAITVTRRGTQKSYPKADELSSLVK